MKYEDYAKINVWFETCRDSQIGKPFICAYSATKTKKKRAHQRKDCEGCGKMIEQMYSEVEK